MPFPPIPILGSVTRLNDLQAVMEPEDGTNEREGHRYGPRGVGQRGGWALAHPDRNRLCAGLHLSDVVKTSVWTLVSATNAEGQFPKVAAAHDELATQS